MESMVASTPRHDRQLASGWAEGERPPGDELLVNGDFARGLEGWTLERQPGAEAAARTADTAPEARREAKSVQITVTQPGTQTWHIRFQQSGLHVAEDRSCTASFWAKADQPCVMHLSVQQAHAPWAVLSPTTEVALTPQWRSFRFLLPVNQTDDQARVIFDPPMQAGTFWLAGVSLRRAVFGD